MAGLGDRRMIGIETLLPETGWKIRKIIMKDGTHVYLSGATPRYPITQKYLTDRSLGDVVFIYNHGEKLLLDDMETIDEVPNFLFQANMFFIESWRGTSSHIAIMQDIENKKQFYHFGIHGIGKFFKGLQAGHINVINGAYSGIFKYIKHGNSVHVVPATYDYGT